MAKALLLWRWKETVSEQAFVEGVVWQLPKPVEGSAHSYKYSLAFVTGGVCVLRFDNERGKGDHKHVGEREEPYVFRGLERLIRDFYEEVGEWQEP